MRFAFGAFNTFKRLKVTIYPNISRLIKCAFPPYKVGGTHVSSYRHAQFQHNRNRLVNYLAGT